jgi:hypothetical protein
VDHASEEADEQEVVAHLPSYKSYFRRLLLLMGGVGAAAGTAASSYRRPTHTAAFDRESEQ